MKPVNISLITSWFDAPAPPGWKDGDVPPSIAEPLREGFNLLDLYFIGHTEIRWFNSLRPEGRRLKEKDLPGPDRSGINPTDFAADLNLEDIEAIASGLRKALHMQEPRRGIVAWHPRITALATFFPDLSAHDVHDDSGKTAAGGRKETAWRRRQAIRAVRNSLCLAHFLGASVVEVVGGSGVPEQGSAHHVCPEAYASAKLLRLAKSILCVYHKPSETDEDYDSWEGFDFDTSRLPPVAMELEPGPSFLLNSLGQFTGLLDIYREMSRDTSAAEKLTFNLDIAHAFMIGYTPQDLKRLSIPVSHFHASDHASDLVPGKFHSHAEYGKFLEYAVELARDPKNKIFSGCIAIELEACNQLDRLHAAATNLRRWLNRRWLSPAIPDADELHKAKPGELKFTLTEEIEGHIITVDLGNSTKTMGADSKKSIEYGVVRQASIVQMVMRRIYEEGGCILSFGGDGFIAIFEVLNNDRTKEAARVHTLLEELAGTFVKKQDLKKKRTIRPMNLRLAVHFGAVKIISVGPLRNQALGLDLVTSVRLCDHLKDAADADAKGHSWPYVAIAVTEEVHQAFPPAVQNAYQKALHRQELRDGSGIARIFWYHRRNAASTAPDAPPATQKG